MNNNSGGWNGGGPHSIHMRGLPFRATQNDIADVSTFYIILYKAQFLFSHIHIIILGKTIDHIENNYQVLLNKIPFEVSRIHRSV